MLGQRASERLGSSLQARHVIMISLSATVGTGFYLGTADFLRHGGPLGMLLAYLVMSTVVFAVMQCIGEIISFLPLPGGTVQLADRFVGPELSFAMGWNIRYTSTILVRADLAAVAILMGHWDTRRTPAEYITVGLVFVAGVNLFSTQRFANVVLMAASLSLAALLTLIVSSAMIVAGIGREGAIGARYWRSP